MKGYLISKELFSLLMNCIGFLLSLFSILSLNSIHLSSKTTTVCTAFNKIIFYVELN